MNTQNNGSESAKKPKRTIWYGIAWVTLTALFGYLLGNLRLATNTPPGYWILAAVIALGICEIVYRLIKQNVTTKSFSVLIGGALAIVASAFSLFTSIGNSLMEARLPITDSVHIFADVEHGEEKDGYGLYSYVLFRNFGAESRIFISAITDQFDAAVEAIRIQKRAELNAIVIPAKLRQRTEEVQTCPGFFIGNEDDVQSKGRLYDQVTARNILRSICLSGSVSTICKNKQASGPFLVTFVREFVNLGDSEPVLVWDLSAGSPRDFGEFVYAYGQQVLRDDIGDRAELETFRLQMINGLSTVIDSLDQAVAAVAVVKKAVAGEIPADSDISPILKIGPERPECS